MAAYLPYDKNLPYTYVLGIFPSIEVLNHRADDVLAFIYHADFDGLGSLKARCEGLSIPFLQDHKLLSKLSPKENVYVAAVLAKKEYPIKAGNHIVLVNPSNAGNLGTIIRTMVGFGWRDLVIIRPAVEVEDPKTIRAAMGANAQLRVSYYASFDQYRMDYPNQVNYPFMLKGSIPLQTMVLAGAHNISFIFGNEGSGLPDSFLSVGTPVKIEHTESIDSLNLSIAVSIALYHYSLAAEF